MKQRRYVQADQNGIPAPVTALPLGFPTMEGTLLMGLVLAVDEAADRADLDAFVTRHRFVTRDQTARAADSQARWTYEEGRVTVTFLAEDGVSSLQIPAGPEMDRWVALARMSGGTVSVMVTYGVPADIDALRRYLSPGGGPYWHLSVGCVPA
ncbi:hypothetical protein [Streptomyces sp. NRRL F-5053]|uniref:hypothetical protein n=1 Tax=Streptomyces sp. NRRL F-5053 TaxID=1463854 RepID=UPI0004C59964|nr:hypothetical protein [Streptomyces sp. NRRL F-5053]